MSQELPVAVWESTSPEVKRYEGDTYSAVSISTLKAGDLVKFGSNSGLIQCVAADPQPVIRTALYDAASGVRVTTIRGIVRARWDGVGAPVLTSLLGASATRSGWFEVSAVTSGNLVFATYADTTVPNPGATVSGTLLIVRYL